MLNIACSDEVGVPRPTFHWVINDVFMDQSGQFCTSCSPCSVIDSGRACYM